MKSIRKLNSMLFDVAPPLIILGVVFIAFVAGLLVSIVLFAVWLVRKAIARNKRKAAACAESNAAAGPGNERK